MVKLQDVIVRDRFDGTATVTDNDFSAMLPHLLDETTAIPLFVGLARGDSSFPSTKSSGSSPNAPAKSAPGGWMLITPQYRCGGSPVT
ncbi:hypothetical protein ACQPXM_11960 [Kribbella sp. CA-253562]|uniref:hypothetical protein n=1 Tax=Kribbella sp. CA-253562 TaxID=3239942 RepID=UPI003D8EBC83